MIKKFVLPLILFLTLISILYCVTSNDILYSKLEKQVKQIDDEFQGNLGVYIKNLKDGSTINYNSDRHWYLASTVKIPIAIVILQKIEDGEFSLDDKVVMKDSDLVDGNGDMIGFKVGTSFTVRELLERMIRDSDSIAADMLIRLIGDEDKLNKHIKENIIGEGIEPITTILHVRYKVYSELHENASKLTNLGIIKLKEISSLDERLNEFARMISVDRNQLKQKSIPDAFEHYYDSKLNSAYLWALGKMLENLVEGEYLNEKHTDLLLNYMKNITTGERRIKAGMPKGTVWASKTGTQIGRACNIGIVFPPKDKDPIIVIVCTEKFVELSEAESAFKKVGQLVTENWLK